MNNIELDKNVLSIDFDGCIVHDKYPNIGEFKLNAKKVLKRLYIKGYKIIINTCRAGIQEGDVYEFLNYHHIPYEYINCNLPERIFYYKQDCRKISADLYIDDKNLHKLYEDWEEIYDLILERLPL